MIFKINLVREILKVFELGLILIIMKVCRQSLLVLFEHLVLIPETEQEGLWSTYSTRYKTAEPQNGNSMHLIWNRMLGIGQHTCS